MAWNIGAVRQGALSLLVFGAACRPSEPVVLPADPAATGVPVGVRTEEIGGTTVEIWYPASDATSEQAPTPIDLDDLVPASFEAHIGAVDLPEIASTAVRDAEVRPADALFPVVLFSHGFGGFAQQSASLTEHLASRGYVVLAPDHTGRRLGDLLPCMFSPPLEGCDLSGFGSDPAPPQLTAALDWASDLSEDDPLFEHLDLEHVGMVGHSAGGGSTGTMLDTDDRVDVGVPMAMGPDVARDVPVLDLAGSCDGVVPIADVRAAGQTRGTLGVIVGAGHLAFSDLCDIDLGALGAELLADREDLNRTFYDGLQALGTDGCTGYAPPAEVCESASYLDLAASDEIVRWTTTVFLDASLRGGTLVVTDAPFAEVTWGF